MSEAKEPGSAVGVRWPELLVALLLMGLFLCHLLFLYSLSQYLLVLL